MIPLIMAGLSAVSALSKSGEKKQAAVQPQQQVAQNTDIGSILNGSTGQQKIEITLDELMKLTGKSNPQVAQAAPQPPQPPAEGGGLLGGVGEMVKKVPIVGNLLGGLLG